MANEKYVAIKRLYLNEDRSQVVPENSPAAYFLLAAKGGELSMKVAEKYGLLEVGNQEQSGDEDSDLSKTLATIGAIQKKDETDTDTEEEDGVRSIKIGGKRKYANKAIEAPPSDKEEVKSDNKTDETLDASQNQTPIQ